jgi:glycerophosphoryl diester phosphodiesterase
LELLTICREEDLSLNLEIKHATKHAAAVPTVEEKDLERELAKIVCQTLREFGPAPGRLIISSFSISALEVCQDMLPEIPRSYLVIFIPDDWETTARRLGCVSLNFHHTSATQEQVVLSPT